MAKVLVTGSEGYIGSVLMPTLIRNKFDVSGLDVCYYSEGNLNKCKFPHYRIINKDIRDVARADLENEDYYAIVHLAALSNDPLGTLNEQLTYDINYKASVQLAEIAKEVGVKRFVFASSCSLYGYGGNHVLTEDSPSNPQTAYGKSKILAEQEISKLADENFSPVFLRNATAFGISPRMRFDIVVNNLTGFAKVDNEIKILGDGKPWRPLVHVKDICETIIATLQSRKEVIYNQAYNVGDNKENYQIRNIAERIKKYYPECNISIAKKDVGDSRDYNVSFSKLNNLLGFKCSWTLDKGIEELKSEYEVANLDIRKFEGRLYTRLKQIEYLMGSNALDSSLRFK